MDLSNEQIEQISITILPDIHQYIVDHQEEYSKFLELEVKKKWVLKREENLITEKLSLMELFLIANSNGKRYKELKILEQKRRNKGSKASALLWTYT